MSGLITGIFFWACERYNAEEDMVRVSVNGEQFDSYPKSSIDTCIGDLLPYSYDFSDTGSVMVAFISNKPQFIGSIWSYDSNTIYNLDSANDTIHLSNGNVYFHSEDLLGNNPVSVTINDTTYLSPDTIYLGADVTIWKVCVNPLQQ